MSNLLYSKNQDNYRTSGFHHQQSIQYRGLLCCSCGPRERVLWIWIYCAAGFKCCSSSEVIASANVAIHEWLRKPIYRERGVVSAFTMSAVHCAVTVIGKSDTFAICTAHNSHNKSLLSLLPWGVWYIKTLFALTSENLRAKLVCILNTSQIRSSLRVRPSKKSLSLFDNGVQFELCNCLNGEVMRAEFYLLLSGGMIQFFRS